MRTFTLEKNTDLDFIRRKAGRHITCEPIYRYTNIRRNCYAVPEMIWERQDLEDLCVVVAPEVSSFQVVVFHLGLLGALVTFGRVGQRAHLLPAVPCYLEVPEDA